MNILIVHNFYKIPGGEDSVVKNEIELLKMHGHNVYTYFKDNKNISTNGIFNKIKLFKNTIFNRTIKKEIQAIIKENKIDIVHCHNTFPLISPSIYKYSKQMGCKAFQTIHNFRFLCASADFVRNECICQDCINKGMKCALKNKCYHNSFSQTLSWYKLQKNFRRKKLYKYVDKFICLTEFNKEILSNIIPNEKIVVKPNFSFFERIEDSSKDKTHFLYIGRIEKIKGIQTLIDVFNKENMSKLVICGTGNDLNYFKNNMNNANIVFKGFCNKEELSKELDKSIALIVPSNWYEGFPMTIAEAMSVGVPIIARNIGNLPYIVKNNETGLLFNTNEELTGLVSYLNTSQEKRKELSNNCIKYVNEYLSPNENYKILMDIYEGR